MTEAEAIQIATAYVVTEIGERLKVSGVSGERKRRRKPLGDAQDPPEWLVYFERPLPEGTLSIEPADVMVIVDENTRQARFSPSL